MKKIITICAFVFACLLPAGMAVSQQPSGQELKGIVEQARQAHELGDLNKVRIILRNIRFDSLATVEERSLYAEAYRMLAWSHRRNRYIRPGYDLYAKFISLRDTIYQAGLRNAVDSVNTHYMQERSALEAALATSTKEEKQLLSDKKRLDSARGTYWLIRVIIVIAVLAISAYLLVIIRRKTARARREKARNFDRLKELNDGVIRGQMTTGSLYHAQLLNSRIHDETLKLNKLMPGIEEQFTKVKESAEVVKNARDNLSRIGKLSELTGKALSGFFSAMPVFELRGRPGKQDEGKASG